MTDDSTRVPQSWLFAGVGCGLLTLLSLCIASAWAAFAFVNETDPIESEAPTLPVYDAGQPLRTPPPAPAPAPQPSMPIPPPGQPVIPPPGQPAIPPPDQHQSWRIQARVTEVDGLSNVRVGSLCEFNVRRFDRPDHTFWCNAQITCGGQLLYGGTNAGFFDCTLYDSPERHVVGEDPSTTQRDRDSAMRLNTLSHELTVHDDASGRLGAFRVRAEITAVR